MIGECEDDNDTYHDEDELIELHEPKMLCTVDNKLTEKLLN